jgi:hypothetical protein
MSMTSATSALMPPGSGGPQSGCQSLSDKTYLNTKQDGDKTGRDLASNAASKCGLGCLNSQDPKACAVTCMKDDEGVELSDPCAGCYGDIVLCTIKNCASKCIADSAAKVCTDCQAEKGCTSAFYACTGDIE